MWNRNIDEAPKGKWKERDGQKGSKIKYHDPVKIIALTSTGEWTVSYWIEKSQRWCMFTKDRPPDAWFVPPPAD